MEGGLEYDKAAPGGFPESGSAPPAPLSSLKKNEIHRDPAKY
jgi:hypothetical protein